MTADRSAAFWQLRLAAAKIADDEMRQLYLNAIAGIVRDISSGRCLGQAVSARDQKRHIPVWEDGAGARYDIALAERRRGAG